MEVNRRGFLEVLHRVLPGLSTRPHIEQSSSFVFKDGWVITFNEEVCCRARSGLPQELEGAVRAAPLMKVLETVSDEDVEVGIEEGSFKVKGQRNRSHVRMDNSIVLPVDDVASPDEWKLLPEDFCPALEQVVRAAGKSEEEFITICVHMTPKWIECTDRFQACRHWMDLGISSNCLIRVKSLEKLAELDVVKVGETEQWLHFRNKSLVYSVRRHVNEYPSTVLTEVFREKGRPVVFPKSVIDAARLGAIFKDEEHSTVRVTIRDNRLEVKGQNNQGFSTDIVDLRYDGEPVVFRVNPDTLAHLVRSHNEVEVAEGKLFVRGENWVYFTVLGTEN